MALTRQERREQWKERTTETATALREVGATVTRTGKRTVPLSATVVKPGEIESQLVKGSTVAAQRTGAQESQAEVTRMQQQLTRKSLEPPRTPTEMASKFERTSRVDIVPPPAIVEFGIRKDVIDYQQQRQDIIGMQQTIHPELIIKDGEVVTKPRENIFEHTTKEIIEKQHEIDKKIEEYRDISIKHGAAPLETPGKKIEREFVTGVAAGATKFTAGATLGLAAVPFGVAAMATQPSKVKEKFVEPYREKLKGIEKRRETYGEFVERTVLVEPIQETSIEIRKTPAMTAGEITGALAVLALGLRVGTRPQVKTKFYEIPATKTIVPEVAPRMAVPPQVLPVQKAPLMRTRTVFETKPVEVPRGLLKSEVAELELIQRPRLRQKSELLYKPESEIVADSKAWVQAHVVKPKTLVIKTKLVPETLKPLRTKPKAPETALLMRQTITQKHIPLVLPITIEKEKTRLGLGVIPYTDIALDNAVKTQAKEMMALITTPTVRTKLIEKTALIQVEEEVAKQKQRVLPIKTRELIEMPPPLPIVLPISAKKKKPKPKEKRIKGADFLKINIKNPQATIEQMMTGGSG